jgi:hypothetical protein
MIKRGIHVIFPGSHLLQEHKLSAFMFVLCSRPTGMRSHSRYAIGLEEPPETSLTPHSHRQAVLGKVHCARDSCFTCTCLPTIVDILRMFKF